MIWKRVTAILLLVVVVAGVGLYSLLLLFTEDLYSERGSFAYYVTIRSSTIKNFPMIQFVGEESFYSSCGDGPKLPANGIRYVSNGIPQDLKQSIERYLLGSGFVRDVEGQYTTPDGNTLFEVDIIPENSGLQRVVATEYYVY
jgi:hypothetical protein